MIGLSFDSFLFDFSKIYFYLFSGKQFGDPCESSSDCAFRSSICDTNKRNCQCLPGLVATDHIDKCGESK